jgi:hypothetical protein
MRRCAIIFFVFIAFTQNASAQQHGEYVVSATVDGDEYAKLTGTITIVSTEKNKTGASIHLKREIAEFRGGGPLRIENGDVVIDVAGSAYNRTTPVGECKMRFTGRVVAGKMSGRWESLAGCTRMSGKGAFTAERKTQ